MASLDGQVFSCRREDRVLLRVVGRATASVCPELRHFAENCFADGVRRVGVDLGECTHFDSTFVGTLLFLKRRSSGGEEAGFALTAASPACNVLLRKMAVAQLFPLVEDDNPGTDARWTELNAELNPQRVSEFKQNIVDAHQELAKLNGSVGEQFKAVADACSREHEQSNHSVRDCDKNH